MDPFLIRKPFTMEYEGKQVTVEQLRRLRNAKRSKLAKAVPQPKPILEVTPTNDPAPTYNFDAVRIRRKLDQAYECAGCARQDGDQKDADRWMAEVARLRELLRLC